MDLNDKKDEIKSIFFLLDSTEDFEFIKGVDVSVLLKEKKEEMLSLISKSKSLHIAKSLQPYISKVDNILNELNK